MCQSLRHNGGILTRFVIQVIRLCSKSLGRKLSNFSLPTSKSSDIFVLIYYYLNPLCRFQRYDLMPGAAQTSTRRTILVKKYINVFFVFRKWPIVSLDKTIFLSWDRAEPFEALLLQPFETALIWTSTVWLRLKSIVWWKIL